MANHSLVESTTAPKNKMTLPLKEDCKKLQQCRTKLNEAIFYGFHDSVIKAALAVAEMTGQSRESAKQKALDQTISHLQQQVHSLEKKLQITGIDLFSYQQKYSAENANVHNLKKKVSERDHELVGLSRKVQMAEDASGTARKEQGRAEDGWATARQKLSIHQAYVHKQGEEIKDLQLRNQSLQAELVVASNGVICCHNSLDQGTQRKEITKQEDGRLQESLNHCKESVKVEKRQEARLAGLKNTEQHPEQLQHALDQSLKEQWKVESTLQEAVSNIGFFVRKSDVVRKP